MYTGMHKEQASGQSGEYYECAKRRRKEWIGKRGWRRVEVTPGDVGHVSVIRRTRCMVSAIEDEALTQRGLNQSLGRSLR